MPAANKQLTENKLIIREHFILNNIKGFIGRYAGLWVVALLLAYVVAIIAPFGPEIDYSNTKAFASAILSLSITTITFAIPTCMRTIFSAYENYYSTPIKEMLIKRFPITLLTLSSFTSLFVSLAVVSGLLGAYIYVAPSTLFAISAFWGLVCIYYLFLSIEKMIYFVVKAPGAILDKLEFEVHTTNLTVQEEYEKFLDALASINDIAATIIARSTGRDEVIIRCLAVFRSVYAECLEAAVSSTSPVVQRRYYNACRAVLDELVRSFRESSASKNEHATLTVIDLFCEMACDSSLSGASVEWVDEMISYMEKFSSYAMASTIDEIEEQVTSDWFFILAAKSGENATPALCSAAIRQLSMALKRDALAGKDSLLSRFFRSASNSNVRYAVDGLPDRWKGALDRSVFVFLCWVLQEDPPQAERYMDYIRTYTTLDKRLYRSVVPDTERRIARVLEYDQSALGTDPLTAKRAYRVVTSPSVGADVVWPEAAFGPGTPFDGALGKRVAPAGKAKEDFSGGWRSSKDNEAKQQARKSKGLEGIRKLTIKGNDDEESNEGRSLGSRAHNSAHNSARNEAAKRNEERAFCAVDHEDEFVGSSRICVKDNEDATGACKQVAQNSGGLEAAPSKERFGSGRREVGNDRTAVLMAMPKEMTLAKAIAYDVMFQIAGVSMSSLEMEFPCISQVKEVLMEHREDESPGTSRKYDLGGQAVGIY